MKAPEINSSRPCGTITRYVAGCRCDSCMTAMREWNRARRAKTNKSRTCDRCGEPVRSWAGRAADGLTLCKKHREEKRAGNRRAATRRRRAETLLEAYENGGTKGSRVWVQGICLRCGEYFIRLGQASPYCSSVCRRQDVRPGKFISRSGREAIYERDGWVCQLCHEPVDPGAQDNYRASLDHIVPRSKGGSHDPENLRLAHLICNSARGDRDDV